MESPCPELTLAVRTTYLLVITSMVYVEFDRSRQTLEAQRYKYSTVGQFHREIGRADTRVYLALS